MDSNNIPETSKLKTRQEQEPEICQAQGVVNGKPADFPEEVLETIFSHLSDPRDLMAVSNASPQFNRILKPTQSSWLFNIVLPLIFSELDKNDILICRLVSKEWTKSVDIFLQTRPRDRVMTVYPCESKAISGIGDAFSKNHPPHRPQFQSNLVSKDFGMILQDSQGIGDLMDEMKLHPQNPLVLRAVSFDSYAEDEDYWIAVLAFLSKLGHHIWHAHLAPSLNQHQRYHLAHNYSILQRALSFMPNLKTLNVDGFKNDPLGYGADKRLVNSIRRYVLANPLPELPHLHTLSENLPQGPNPVMAELLRKYSDQLKKFRSTSYVWFQNPPEIENLPLSQLVDLQLNFTLCYSCWRNLCRSLVAPNLAKLHLIISADWEIGELLKPLREVHSLTYLGLGLRVRCRDFKYPTPPEFGLERIKTVEIEDRQFVQYDLILNHFPCLEYVLVCHREEFSMADNVDEEAEEDSDDGEVETDDETTSDDDDDEMSEVEVVKNKNDKQLEIRRLMLSGKMYESDVWSRFKFLKEFTLARMGDTG